MISLLYKELLVQKRVLGMAFLYIFVFSFAMKNLGEQLPLAIITAVSYMFVLYGGAWDEKASSDRLWNSLPVPKWKIVGAKYLSVLVYVAGVAGPYLGCLCSAFHGGHGEGFRRLLGWSMPQGLPWQWSA